MRRFALLPIVLALAGCGGADGQRAQQLLQDAQSAQKQLRFATYEGSLVMSMPVGSFRLDMEGGGSFEHGRVADQYLRMRAAGMDFSVVTSGDDAFVGLGDKWERVPVPQGLDTARLGALSLDELAPYVTAVRVYEGEVEDGEPVSVIAGELDTAGFVKAFSRLGELSRAGGGESDLGGLADELGDIHATIAISERTSLMKSVTLTMEIETPAGDADMRFAYKLTSANKPVELPEVRA